MFLEGNDLCGLPRDPFLAIVAPRPIGWIGTRSIDGRRNLAPYSFFNIVSDDPKLVMFSSSGAKDSLRNVRETGVFTVSLVSRPLAEAMNQTSARLPYGQDEFSHAGLEAGEGRLVAAPYVARAPAVLECRSTEIIVPKGLDGRNSTSIMVIGEVVGIHIDDSVLVNGRIDPLRFAAIARMGYGQYADIDTIFEMRRP